MQHQYERLDIDGKPFRLIRLLQGFTGEIECEVFQANLDDDALISYEALSYTWGTMEKLKSISLNGSTFPVTYNLWAALSELRHQGRDRILWIDAISIDQENIPERGQQVQQMAEIYCKADEVLIWLGYATHETNMIMDAMQQLQKRSNHISIKLQKSEPQFRKVWDDVSFDLSHRQGISQTQLRTAMQALLERDWFRRIWVLQEVANARRAAIVCGSKSVSARIFAAMPSLLRIGAPAHAEAVLHLFPYVCTQTPRSSSRSLETLLHDFRRSKATDPRDMIYALLGMSNDAYKTNELRADYSKSLREAIASTAVFILGLGTPEYFERYLPPLQDPWELLSQFQNLLSKPAPEQLLDWILQDRVSDHENLTRREKGDFHLGIALREHLLEHMALVDSVEDIKSFLDKCYSDDKMAPGCGFALVTAIRMGHSGVTNALVKHKFFDINAKDSRSQTALMYAVQTDFKTAHTLLELEGMNNMAIDANLTNKQGDTVLESAIERAIYTNDYSIVGLLIRKKGLRPSLTVPPKLLFSMTAEAREKLTDKLMEPLSDDLASIDTNDYDWLGGMAVKFQRNVNEGLIAMEEASLKPSPSSTDKRNREQGRLASTSDARPGEATVNPRILFSVDFSGTKVPLTNRETEAADAVTSGDGSEALFISALRDATQRILETERRKASPNGRHEDET